MLKSKQSKKNHLGQIHCNTVWERKSILMITAMFPILLIPLLAKITIIIAYLAITKSTQLTPRHASNTYIQISGDNGFRKEKTPGFVPLGLRQRILMPRVMKGLEKSITFSRTQVIVRGAIAKSAFCKKGEESYNHKMPMNNNLFNNIFN